MITGGGGRSTGTRPELEAASENARPSRSLRLAPAAVILLPRNRGAHVGP